MREKLARNRVWLILGVVFLACILAAALLPNRNRLPFSSYSTEDDGTKAAYLLLEELGFEVSRNTREHWNGEGVLLALGPQYLADSSGALVLEEDFRFTNAYIRSSSVEFVRLMWPYRDTAIVFEEYGRAWSPISSLEGEEAITPWSIAPPWLRILLPNLFFAAALVMFFYGQRTGEPQRPREFAGRRPLEGVYAMAGTMERARVFRDSAAYYYRYRTRRSSLWDKNSEMARGLESIRNERDAAALVAEMDRRIEEYENEGK